MGYHRAGFDVVGVDLEPQPHYPFSFMLGDALTVLNDLLVNGKEVDAIHASPPCQGYSRMRHLPWLADKEYPLLIVPVRDALKATGLPYVIENVEDSPLQRAHGLWGDHGILLCGTSFGLPIYRHRPFESNVQLVQPGHGPHKHVISGGRMLKGRGRASSWERESRVPDAMGCQWMTQREAGQAIPPAYTEFIGAQLLAHLALIP
jgi:DNA (cytosine-5)-methyltransferase 1